MKYGGKGVFRYAKGCPVMDSLYSINEISYYSVSCCAGGGGGGVFSPLSPFGPRGPF